MRIWLFPGSYFPFGLNMGEYGPEKTPNAGTLYAVKYFHMFWIILK